MKTIYAILAAGSLLQTSAFAQASYTVTDLGTLGGPYSYAYAMNNAGLVAGGAAKAGQNDGIAQSAFLWKQNQLIDLGNLGGPACPGCSSVGAAASMNGTAGVISELANMDPNGEDFCGFGTHRQCVAAVWKNGQLSALPRLDGGINSQVFWMNSRAEAVGFSENGVPDATCATPFQTRRFEAVKWSPDGKIQQLAPLENDTVGYAFGVNEIGQAIGVSGLCSNTFIPPLGAPSGPHAVLWDTDGRPVDLGSLPGAVAYAATAINNRGDVVGNALFPDHTVHPFFWTRNGGMQDLGVPVGDFIAVAPCCGTVNNSGLLGAFSCPGPFGFCRAVIWQNHRWADLNDLVALGASMYLLNVASINDLGQITGFGFTAGGEIHAYLATPVTR